MGRVGSFAQLAYLAAQVGVDAVEEHHATDEVGGAHGVAPDADRADQKMKCFDCESKMSLGKAKAINMSRLM